VQPRPGCDLAPSRRTARHRRDRLIFRAVAVGCAAVGDGRSAQAFLAAEQGTILNDGAYLKNWRHEIEAKMGRFRAMLRGRAAQNRSIAGFGAPTKATLLMQMADIGHDDIAYVADFKNKVEFMVSAVIYVNSDGILNDDKYEYEEIGYPFFKELGDILYGYELTRKRRYSPDLKEFGCSYVPGPF